MSEQTPQTPPPHPDRPAAASQAEKAARHASDHEIAPHEKRTIGAETSREEDA
jgi:hypothetical protein